MERVTRRGGEVYLLRRTQHPHHHKGATENSGDMEYKKRDEKLKNEKMKN